jgi:hypothetical protein
MILISLILGSAMMFQSGMFWSAYKIDRIEGKRNSKMLIWSIGLGLFGLYFLISMIGKASTL